MRKKFYAVVLSVLCGGAFWLGARGARADYDRSNDTLVCAMWNLTGTGSSYSECQAIEVAAAAARGMCISAASGEASGCCSYDGCYIAFVLSDGSANAMCYATPYVWQ